MTFDCLTSIPVDLPSTSSNTEDSKLQLSLYRHDQGLQVLFIDTPGPASLATIVVPTLSHNNYGLPHTLEHLIFCGSKHYPDRGYLEALATRLLSTGTNAWTSSDHTAYTLSTVGHDALLHAVPVFLDHVLYPTLTDADFLTEVYHIDGKAKQQGVVFSEMGSREYSEADLLDRTLNQLLYQNTTTYSFECGGLTEDIPHLDIEMIRHYHKQFYHPSNLCVILAGQDLPQTALLESLERSPSLQLASSVAPPPHYIEFPPRVEVPQTKVVSFPSDDDTCGSVGYAWRGPRFDDFTTRFALELLLFSFTDSPAAPLNQTFVAPELPLANAVSYEVRPTPETSLWLQFSGVPRGDSTGGSEVDSDTRQLLIPGVFRSMVTSALNSAVSELTLEVLHEGLRRYRVMLLENLEDNACEDLTQSLVSAVVAERFFSIPMATSIHQIGGQFTELHSLQSQPLSFWQDLARTWLLDQTPAEVVATPDLELGKVLESARSASQAERAEHLGPEVLSTIQAKVEEVVRDSKIVLSENAMSMLPPAPDVSQLPQLPSRVRLVPSDSILTRVQLVEVETQFTRFMIGLPTQHIPRELHPYLVLFQNLMFQLDLVDPEQGRINYKDAIRTTDRLTVERYATLGLNNRDFYTNWLPELFFLGGKSEPDYLEAAQDWLLRSLIFSDFTIDRVLSVARNLLSELEETMRDGAELLHATYHQLLKSGQDYDTNLESSISLFRQEEFLTRVITDLTQVSTGPSVLENLGQLRDQLLLGFDYAVVQLSGPIGEFPEPRLPVTSLVSRWKTLFHLTNSQLSSVGTPPTLGTRTPYQFPRDLTRPSCMMIPLGSLTSSFIVSIIPCEVFHDPEVKMAIVTLCELFSRCNGPLFELIRGQGLAYHVTMYLQVWSGNLVLELHDATDPVRALQAVWEFLSSLQDEATWEATVTPAEMSLAQAALTYTSTRFVDCPSALVDGAFRYQFWGFASTEDYVNHYRSHLNQVTLLHLRQAFLQHVVNFLDPTSTQTVLLTPSSHAPSRSVDGASDIDDNLINSDDDGGSADDDMEDCTDLPGPIDTLLPALTTPPYCFPFQAGDLSLFR